MNIIVMMKYFYKNIYGMNNHKNSFVMMHWETIGIKNDYLTSKDMFYKRYNNFDLECYKIYNSGLIKNGINTEELLLKHYWHYGYDENRIINDVKINENFKTVLKHYKIRYAIYPENKNYDILIKTYNLKTTIQLMNTIILIDPTIEMFNNLETCCIFVLLTHSYDVNKYIELQNIINKELINILLTFCSTFYQYNMLSNINCKKIFIECGNKKPIYLNNYDEIFGNKKIQLQYNEIIKKYDERILFYNDINSNLDNNHTCFIIINLTNKDTDILKKKSISYIENNTNDNFEMKIKNNEDIIGYINTIDDKIDNKELKIDKNKLIKIKDNINKFINDISKYNKILILYDISKKMAQKETVNLFNLLNKIKIVSLCDNKDFDLINNNYDLIITKNPLNTDQLNLIKELNIDIIYLVSSIDRCKYDDIEIINMIKHYKSYSNDFNFIKRISNKGLSVKLFYDNLVNCNEIEKLGSYVKKYKYCIASDGQYDMKRSINKLLEYYQYNKDKFVITGTNTNLCNNLIECIISTTNEIMKETEILCIDHRDFLYNVDVVDALLYGCKIINIKDIIFEPYIDIKNIESNIKNSESHIESNILLDILKCKKICILTSLDTYNKFENSIKDFMTDINFLGIDIITVILTNITKYLNNEKIKYIDIYDKVDIEKFVNDFINENYDMILDFNLVKLVNNQHDQIDQINQLNQLNQLKKLKKTVRIYNEIKTLEDINSYYINNKLKIFINFEPKDVPYGGGNSFTLNLCKYINKSKYFEYIFELNENTLIDIYLIVDFRKDGIFKKYSVNEIYKHKNKNKNGIIFYRVNDCDITRINGNREKDILKYFDKIDYFVFNSNFIKDYYFDKYDILITKPYSVIYNTTNNEYFNLIKEPIIHEKTRIVTHHWSDNINKGYDIYQQIYNIIKEKYNDNFEFVFIGRKYNDKYKNDIPKINGPYHGYQLAQNLKKCDIYVSASIYDACPMHILEGLSCGLPVLYIDHDGGGKDICNLSNEKIGESFKDINSFIDGLNRIYSNYNFYVNNIKKNIKLYNSNKCYADYCNLFIKQKLTK
jgi:hypothetical protein